MRHILNVSNNYVDFGCSIKIITKNIYGISGLIKSEDDERFLGNYHNYV